MTSQESYDQPKQSCETCPNRSVLGKLLARTGLASIEAACPGPDIIDRFDVTVRRGDRSQTPPPGYELVCSTTPMGGLGAAARKNYYRSVVDRQEVCSREPLIVEAGETVAETQTNSDGRSWIRVGRGNPAAVRAAEFGRIFVASPFEPLDQAEET